jgi:hypothetical protein
MPRLTPRDASIEERMTKYKGRIGKPAQSFTESIRICTSSFVIRTSTFTSLTLQPSDFGLHSHDRPPRRVKPFEQPVTRVADQTGEFITSFTGWAGDVAHQAEVPVGRKEELEHHLPAPRAVLAAAKNH